VIAFHLPGGVPVDAFALLLGFGASLGLVWALNGDRQKQEILTLDGGLWVLVGALVGARIAYVAVNWGYFQGHLQEIYQLHLGGLAWAGAMVGGMAFLALYASLRRTSLVALADALTPLATALAAAAWLGCWLAGSAYGVKASAWWALPAMDEWGDVARRFPLQLLGAGIILIVQWMIDVFGSYLKSPGVTAGVWSVVFFVEMLVFSVLRADPAPTWQGFRLETLAAGFFLLVSVIGLIKHLFFARTSP
jgi:phosphatidylglycerol:prolipoprotein diacylglycerol transferase